MFNHNKQLDLDRLMEILKELRYSKDIPIAKPLSADELTPDRINGGLDMMFTVYVLASSKYSEGREHHFLAMILTMMNALGIDKQFDLLYQRFAVHLELGK